jgi:hypothetical protein
MLCSFQCTVNNNVHICFDSSAANHTVQWNNIDLLHMSCRLILGLLTVLFQMLAWNARVRVNNDLEKIWRKLLGHIVRYGLSINLQGLRQDTKSFASRLRFEPGISWLRSRSVKLVSLWEPSTLNQALANQHGSRQLHRPLVRTLPSDNVLPTR